ncbi:MerR family transcriptional regulator [Pseudonocardia xinjiangensis]|uniref:MerR family transcriptional regulator n=1 Tax=Pseudonocardia xinjiangensis TaxID=75289 RepID=UPI003D93DB9C
MLIGEFAKRVGVSTDTIRFYEKVGFFSGRRGDNGYRIYSEKDIEVAELIAFGKSMGFSLRDILAFSNEMTAGVLDHSRAQVSLQAKIGLIDARISSLRKVKKLIQGQIDYCRAAEASEVAARSATE